MKIEHFVFVIYLFQQFSFIFYNPHHRWFPKPDIRDWQNWFLSEDDGDY